MLEPMKDWKQLAAARDLNIPAEQLERIVPVMEGLEASFRPLARGLKPEVEPAPVMLVHPERHA